MSAASRMRWAGAIIAACLPLASATDAADTREVTIDNFTFSPPEIVVAAGTTVVWTNRDDIPHNVADALEPKALRSPPLDTDEQYRRTFATTGTFRYFCSLHPRMQGTVTVR